MMMGWTLLSMLMLVGIRIKTMNMLKRLWFRLLLWLLPIEFLMKFDVPFLLDASGYIPEAVEIPFILDELRSIGEDVDGWMLTGDDNLDSWALGEFDVLSDGG